MPRPGPRTTYKYSDEFKATAVRLSELAGVEVQEVVFGPPVLTAEQQLITNAHTLRDQAAKVFAATKPKLAIYSHVILFAGASDDDVISATYKAYSGRVEMGTDLTVIEIGDDISVRRFE